MVYLAYFQEIARSNRAVATTLLGIQNRKKWKIIKQISKQGIEKLLKDGVIRHTHRGYVNPKNGEHIGFYKTCGGKKYIEDYYADLVMK